LVTGGSFGLAISEGGTAGLGLSAGDMYYFNSSAIVSLGLNIPANQWIHVVAVFDGTANTIAVWLNGVLDAAVNVTSTQTTIDTFYRLGLNNTHEFDGNVAETRIYNRALTSTEISQNFNATRGKYGV
jgi:VCBS repeat-containing protein